MGASALTLDRSTRRSVELGRSVELIDQSIDRNRTGRPSWASSMPRRPNRTHEFRSSSPNKIDALGLPVGGELGWMRAAVDQSI